MTVQIGVDIGQRRDPTAVCVAEVKRRATQRHQENHFYVRHLERLALGTSYPKVAERIAHITGRVRAMSGSGPRVYVDATGVGVPVVDLLRERIHGGRVVAVYFIHGNRRTETVKDGQPRVSLGKAYLVSRLLSLLESGRVHLPRTSGARALERELLNYEVRVDENACDRYGAFREGTHDDLVTALGLATQEGAGNRRLH